MTITPHFSIVLTTFNRPETAVRAVESVLAQTYTDWELIIVDDGSATPFSAVYPATDYPAVRHIYQENTGPAGARARGAYEAAGRMYCFLDDDDYYLPDHLAVLAAACDTAAGGQTLLRTGMYSERSGRRRPGPNYDGGKPILPQYWRRPTSLLAYAIPAACAARVPLPTIHSPIEDFEWLVALLIRYPLIQLPDYTTVYTVHPENRTSQLVRPAALRQREDVIERLWSLPGLAARLGEPARRRMLHHQRQHWIRQALRAGRLRSALRELPAAIGTSSPGSLPQWGRTLRTLLSEGIRPATIRIAAEGGVGWLRRQLVYPLYRAILRRKRFAAADARVICATPRSGSTWLVEMLNHLPGTVVSYEPFHLDRAAIPPAARLGVVPVYTERTVTTAAKHYARDALSLRHPTSWTGQMLTLRQVSRAQRVILKSVRAQQALRWMLEEIGLHHPPVVLLRHPLATAHSIVRTFGTRPLPVRPLLAAHPEHYARYAPHLDYLDTLTTDPERWTAHWCIDNRTVLEDPVITDRCLRIYYEHLLLDPEGELRRVVAAWRFPPEWVHRIPTDRPSASDHRSSLLADPRAQLGKVWRYTTREDRRRVQEVLDHFGVTLYHCDDPLPRTGGGSGPARVSVRSDRP